MMGRMAAPVMACRINSAWLMLQAESLSANSAYSSSVMRVLTTRLRCGVLYRFRMVKTSFRLPHGCGGISGVSRISRVWGRHSPTRFPQGQNERKANFGTAVESCSEKLPLSSAADFAAIYKGRCGCFRQYSDYGGMSCPPLFPSTDRNGKCQTLIWIFHHYYGRQAHFGQTSPSLTTTRERGVLPKMGAKNATDFQKSVALLFGAVFNFSLPFPLLGKRKGQPILAVL